MFRIICSTICKHIPIPQLNCTIKNKFKHKVTGVANLSNISSTKNMDTKTEAPSKLEPEKREVQEGKVTIQCDGKHGIFYNPIQEFNRDISILGIDTFIQTEEKKGIKIAEAMAASGIRSIRYAKEIDNVESIVANDYSEQACESIKLNSKLNNVENIIKPSCNDACALMYGQKNSFYVVDLDPYGTPIPFLDSAVQAVENGGLLLVTATDMAVLAGSHADACYSKYGSMPIKSKACHEFALRIVVHAIQTHCNRHGRTAIPLLSLKIDFYVRLLFKVIKSAERAKDTAHQTSMVYQCIGCQSLNFQPLATKKLVGGNRYLRGYAQGPVIPENCQLCNSKSHFGGPLWTGPIHDKKFVASMLDNLNSKYAYLNTAARIEGLLHLVEEEVDTPVMYDIQQLCSIIKCTTVPMLRLRSAFLEIGHEMSLSHTGPNTLKTNAPNTVIWDILRSWHTYCKSKELPPGTPGQHILSKTVETLGIDFDNVRIDANPVSRQKGVLRYQMNPTKFWGPGSRNEFHKKEEGTKTNKRARNQSRRKKEKELRRAAAIKSYEDSKQESQNEPSEHSSTEELEKQPEVKIPKLQNE